MSNAQTAVTRNYTFSQSVVEAVAEAQDVAPEELTPPLYDVLDPDALEQLFARRFSIGKIVFNYNGCEVSVFSDGYVFVEKQDG